MRVVIFGLGVRGVKHLDILGEDVVATVDPNNELASNKTFREIDPNTFDIGIVCTDEKSKQEIIDWLLSNSKHVLVEKPLLFSVDQLNKWSEDAIKKEVLLRVAYNLRHEYGVNVLRKLIDEQSLGKIYRLRLFYGNGTAQDIKASKWRNNLRAVSSDLLTHLLDLSMYVLREDHIEVRQLFETSYEIDGADHAVFVGNLAGVDLLLEASYLSWKNRFDLEMIAEYGSVSIQGLDKWNNHTVTEYKRKWPSGIPETIVHKISASHDSTKLQWQVFIDDIRSARYSSDLSKDIQIARILS